MFKPSERRFEYNINPQGEDLDRYAPRHTSNARTPEYHTSTATPANKRASLNYSLLDDHRPAQDFPPRNEERYEPRGRVSSETMMKRSTDRSANAPRNKNQYEEPFKQTKKVYFGVEDGFREQEPANQRDRTRPPYRDENRRYNGEDYTTFAQDNANTGNLKPDKEKQRKGENRQEISDYGVNEKQIMEKIGRINRLNEEINNRLQRMLNKIDGA